MNKLIQLILLVTLSAASFSVNANLVQRDLNGSSDGLITFDTSSSLEWLDLKETLGLSFNSILSGYGGYINSNLNSFRFATESEFSALLNSAGISNGVAYNTNSYESAVSLMALVGCGAQCNTPYPYSEGWIYSDTGGPATRAYIQHNTESLIAGGRSYGGSGDPQIGEIWTGSWLVRSVTAVPELDTSAMLLMGAGVMGFMARRRKQAAA